VENTRALSDLPVSAPRFAGRAVNRIKDPMLLTGRAEFVSGDRRRDRCCGHAGMCRVKCAPRPRALTPGNALVA
jgi:hypothetical protein